ncbi:MAG: NUDIX domain-containing protein [Candidatus Aenigmarchaeota archaeon]|nr:NUDIX domain-containing protein [Candidatus Aenigmarchaeota archaeon]
MDIGQGRVRLSVAAVIKKDDKILLGIRKKKGAEGKWILPGGGVDFMERLEDALKREIKEEVGIEVIIKDEIGVYEILWPPLDLHKVIIYYWADYKSGEIIPSDDISEARFFSKEEVKDIIESGKSTDTIKQVLKDINWI